ncbi:MAG: PEP-CTERM system TPR-repeat protein PrsT [Kiloniellales bacterium]|nr:PEP-CTERM system TPR-repeat protein PrsT [Kiloniellales bacterium]
MVEPTTVTKSFDDLSSLGSTDKGRGRRLVPLIFVIFAFGALAACDEIGSGSGEQSLKRAEEFQAAGDFQSSLIEVKSALQKEPNNGQARLLLGEIYLELNDVLSAEKELFRARDLEVEPELMVGPLGRLWLMQEKYDEILTEISIDEGSSAELKARVSALRGRAHAGLAIVNGDPEELTAAERAYTRALTFEPESATAIVGLGRVAMSRDRLDEAQDYLTRAIDLAPDDLDVITFQGEVADEQMQYDLAETAFQKLVDRQPYNPIARLALARAMIGGGKHNDALQHVELVLRDFADSPVGNYYRALIAYQDQNHDLARLHADRVLEIQPADTPSLLIAGAASYSLGRYEQALRYLNALIERVPSHQTGLRILAATRLKLGEFDAAISNLVPVTNETTGDAQLFAAVGSAAVLRGDFQSGHGLFERAVALEPDNIAARMNLGLTRIGLGDAEQGLADLERAFNLDHTNVLAATHLFNAYYQQKNYDAAIEVARKLQEALPESTQGFNLAGVAYAGKGDNAAAEALFRKAFEVKPGDPDTAANLAVLALRNEDLDEVRRLYREALDHNPGHLPTILRFADIEARTGRVEQVISLLEEAVEYNPDSVEPRLALGRIYLNRNEPEPALTALEGAPQQFRTSANFLLMIGQAQLMTGRPAKAIDTIERLVRTAPESVEARVLLAQSLTLLGRRERAREELETALEIDPEHRRARFEFAQHLTLDGEFEEAADLLAELKEELPDSSLIPELEGQIALAQSRPEDAVALYEVAFEQREAGPVLVRLVDALFRVDRDDEGRKLVADWLEKFPGDLATKLAFARILAREGELDEADMALQELSEIEPDSSIIAELQGDIALGQGRFDDAVALLSKAFEGRKINFLLVKLANAHFEAGQMEQGQKALQGWLDDSPNDLVTRFVLADSYRSQERWEEAKQGYESIVELAPDNVVGLNNLAFALLRLGLADEALTHARRAYRLTGDDPDVLDTLGLILLETGQADEAVRMLRSAAEKLPDALDTQFHLAQALAATGEADQAKRILQDLIAQDQPFDSREEAASLLGKLDG